MPSMTDCDAAVFADLFERLRPRLTAISRRIVGSEADAQDIVQDCFLKWQAWQADGRGAAAPLATPAAWLTTVVQHGSIDFLRRRTRETAAAHMAMELAPPAAPDLPEDGLARRDQAGAVLARLLARLSPAERLAVVLREGFDRDYADIAATLGTTAANARQHLSRARKRLRMGAPAHEPDLEEKLCRELVRRFQAALNGLDVTAAMNLLAQEQPLAVGAPPVRAARCRAANDGDWRLAA